MPKKDASTDPVNSITSGTTESRDVRSVVMTIFGQPASLKNSRRLWKSRRTGKTFSAKSEPAEKYMRDFYQQVPAKYRNLGLGSLKEPLRMVCTVFYSSRRSDLDVGAIMDGLQAAGVIRNDRDIIEQHLFAEVDPKNPRVELIVEYL